MKVLLFKISISISSVMLMCLSLEGIARIYKNYTKHPVNHYEHRINEPLPYKDASYYSNDFINESFAREWIFPENTRMVIPKDINGTFFNVIKGHRKTFYQPSLHDNIIHVFGGSTIFQAAVPDEYTICSQLQLQINKIYPNKYKVLNYGAASVTTTQQLERLIRTEINSNDLVIFYDGVNDVLQSLLYANPDETMLETQKRTYLESNLYRKLLSKLKDKSVFIDLFVNKTKFSYPNHILIESKRQKLVESLESRFRLNIKKGAAYCSKRNATFIHFLQPHLFSDKQYTVYEKELMNNKNLILPGAKYVFEIGYERLKDLNFETEKEIKLFDISDCLNERVDSIEYFLDLCHTNHLANQKIASVISENIREFLN